MKINSPWHYIHDNNNINVYILLSYLAFDNSECISSCVYLFPFVIVIHDTMCLLVYLFLIDSFDWFIYDYSIIYGFNSTISRLAQILSLECSSWCYDNWNPNVYNPWCTFLFKLKRCPLLQISFSCKQWLFYECELGVNILA